MNVESGYIEVNRSQIEYFISRVEDEHKIFDQKMDEYIQFRIEEERKPAWWKLRFKPISPEKALQNLESFDFQMDVLEKRIQLAPAVSSIELRQLKAALNLSNQNFYLSLEFVERLERVIRNN